jgi:hypothetical protein
VDYAALPSLGVNAIGISRIVAPLAMSAYTIKFSETECNLTSGLTGPSVNNICLCCFLLGENLSTQHLLFDLFDYAQV